MSKAQQYETNRDRQIAAAEKDEAKRLVEAKTDEAKRLAEAEMVDLIVPPEKTVDVARAALPILFKVDTSASDAGTRLMKAIEDGAEALKDARALLVGDIAWQVWGNEEFLHGMEKRGVIGKMQWIPRSQAGLVEVRLCPSLGDQVLLA